MIPGMNKRQVEQAMRKMGIQQEDIDAELVIIRTKDKEIIIEQPSVAKVKMMGNESFQISGKIKEKSLSTTPEISEEDIKVVVEQTDATRQEAVEAIKQANGDLVEAILLIQNQG